MKLIQLVVQFVFLMSLVSCGNDASEQSTESGETSYHNDYRIGVYTSRSGRGSNSYWVEGPKGVVLIDTQFLLSDAAEFVDIAESVTGKKVVMAIVLHASPDRFNGVSILKERKIPVVSAAQVVDEIPAAHERASRRYAAQFPGDYPTELVLPEVRWTQTRLFDAAGLRFKAYVIREGVSEAHLLVGLDDQLFVGDLVVYKYHADMQLGKSQHWLQRLEEIRRFSDARVIFPGKGYAMAAESLINHQQAYLTAVQKVIAEFYTGGRISDPDVKEIQGRITHQFGGYGDADLLPAGIRAEWEQMRLSDHEMM